MNKYLKYSWLLVLVVVPILFSFSKTEQDIFTVASSGRLSNVQEEISTNPNLLHAKDANGFTVLDYSFLNQDSDISQWLKGEGVYSGVNPKMIERVRLWFLLLDIPVNSNNFYLKGVYDEGLRDAILTYQITRGLNKDPRITPDWFIHLEEDGVRFLQSILFGENSADITGVWDDASDQALRVFQKEENLPQTGHLSIEDIVHIKRKVATSSSMEQDENPAQENDRVTPVVPLQSDFGVVSGISTNQVADKYPSIKIGSGSDVKKESADIIEDETQENKEATKINDKAKDTSGLKSEKLTTGFLLDSNAKPGKMLNLQIWLTLVGHPTMTLDGQMGPESRQVIMDYEKSIGLEPKGELHSRWEAPLEKEIWRKVQEKLTQLKLYDQGIDGIPGTATVEALKAYEESSNLTPSGKLLPETLSALFNEGQMFNDGSFDEMVIMHVDHTEEDEIFAVESSDEFGEMTGEAVKSQEDSDPSSEPEVTIGLPGFNPKGTESDLMLQLMFTIIGQYEGEINGEMSDALIDSIKKFQKDNELGVDGKAGRQTLSALNKQVITQLQLYFKNKKLLEDDPTGTLGPKTRRVIKKLKDEYQLPEGDIHQLDLSILLIMFSDLNNVNYVKMYQDMLEQQRVLKEKTEKAQEYLTALGYFSGKIDGVLGKSTQESINKYKKAQKLATNNDELNDQLFDSFKSQTVRKVQEELVKLGYKLKVDGLMGPGTKRTIETFQKRYNYKVTGEPVLETLHQVNTRVLANSKRALASSSSAPYEPIKGVMPSLASRGNQPDQVLTAAPPAISGRMSLIHNSKGQLAGCKVNNISISATMCGGAKNNQQCRVVYQKGRVLSVSCKG